MVQLAAMAGRSPRAEAQGQKGRSWGGAIALAALLTVGCGVSSPPTGTTALSYEEQLAQHLSQTGSVMYGAYWCPHCADQKAIFGEAASQIPYVECAADGAKAQPQLCKEKGIQGYPTWEIGGQLYPGVQSLEELANRAGFQAPAAQP